MGQMKNTYKILSGKSEEYYLEDLGIERRTISKCILGNKIGGCRFVSSVSVVGCFSYGNELSGGGVV
jgi:hypothetical protein